MTNVLVILSGCGVFDGSEIHEAVSTLLHLDRHEATVTFAAPDGPQKEVINHLNSQPMEEQRNVRIEAARIARGPVEDVAAVKGDSFDAVVLPGGFGAATNLSTFADDGPECTVDEEVARVLREAHEAGRPIGFICIAPSIAARLFPGATLTIGTDADTAAALESMGARHEKRPTEEICVDEDRRIVTTPAYMTAERIGQVYEGIGKLVDRVLAMAATPASTAAK
jgi:enhancing lycopene biosynthesis protein 2